MRALPCRLTVLLLTAVFVLTFWRARTQTFTVDEAHVFRMYVNRPLGEMARTYDACNHVLHTLLMKLSRSLLGTGELALRVPSLLGALLFLRAIYVLTGRLFSGWWQPLVAAAAVLHPLVLDHLVAARGYGLGLALFLWALIAATDWLTRGHRDRDLLKAGVLAGLSVGTNLTFLVPSTALGVVLLLLAAKGRRWWTVIEKYAVASITIAFLINVLPLLHATRADFYVGEVSWKGALLSFIRRPIELNPSLAAPLTRYQDALSTLAAAVFLAVAVASGFLLIRYLRQAVPSFRLAPPVLLGGTLAIAVLVHALLFHIGGVLYPMGRTGLYLVPLLELALAGAARAFNLRHARTAAATILALTAVFWITRLETRYFQEWRFDSATMAMLRRIDEDRQSRRLNGEVRLATSPYFVPTVQYYRLRRRMYWIPEVPVSEHLDSSTAEYYLLVSDHARLIPQLGLTLIHKDGTTGTLVARRPS